MKKTLVAIFSATLVALSFAACAKKSISSNQLRFRVTSEPPSLDWNLATDHVSIYILYNLMEGLVEFNSDLTVKPALAESWKISEDGKTYIFKIRTGVVWSDGVPLTAHDFEYSWKRLLDPKTASEYAYFLFDIEGAQDFNAGKIRDTRQVGIRALDNSTLEVKLTKAASYFINIPAHTSTFPLRKDVAEKYGESWTEPKNIVTVGPYTLSTWEHDYKVILKRNPKYWGTAPKIEEIVAYVVNEDATALHLYETGKLDHLSRLPSTDLPKLETRPDFIRAPYLRGYYYGFNTAKKPFNDARVRKAFAMSVDRSVFPKILKGGQLPTASWVPPGMPGHNPTIGLPYDPEKARQLLKEAGYPNGQGLPKVILSFDTRDDNKLIAESLQQQWKRNLNVPVEIQNQEWKVHLKTLQVDPPHLWRLGWGADYPDPDNFMNLFTSYSGNNHTRWQHKGYDDLIAKAAGELNWARRKEFYDQAQKILCEDEVPIIPLFVETQNVLLKPHVRDFVINSLDILLFKTARIEK